MNYIGDYSVITDRGCEFCLGNYARVCVEHLDGMQGRLLPLVEGTSSLGIEIDGFGV
jgi:hypothetical protein